MKLPNQPEKTVGVRKLRKVQIFYMIIVGLFAVGLIMLGSKYSLTAQIASLTSSELSQCNTDLQGCQASLSDTNNQLSGCRADYTTSQGDLASCNKQASLLNTNYTTCKTQMTSTQGQLSTCNSDKSACQGSLSLCNTDRNSCQGDLSSCNSAKSSIQSSFDTLAQNFASSKCCGTTNYPYYYVENSNVVCTNDSSANTKATGC